MVQLWLKVRYKCFYILSVVGGKGNDSGPVVYRGFLCFSVVKNVNIFVNIKNMCLMYRA